MVALKRPPWAFPVLLLGGVALGWFVLVLAVEDLTAPSSAFWTMISGYRAGDVQAKLGSLPEVVVAILGIAITVVSIVVQLTATRYTPRVTELFFRDRTNLSVLGFFVITSIHSIWATFVIHQHFVPRILVAVTLAMMTAAILLLVPYFIYVFAFLDPERLVMRLQRQALAAAIDSSSSASLDARQRQLQEDVEQLADVAINAVSNKDRVIASRSLDALKELASGYLARKRGIDPNWFVIGACLRQNPDFTVMAPSSVTRLSQQRSWLEFKILRQYQTVFHDAMNRMRSVGQLVAINTRAIGETAIKTDDHDGLQLVVKFFNTFLRATINARDVRSAYNVLHQYRQLGEALLKADGWTEEVSALGHHFKYYGQTANNNGLPFITETTAYDMCRLCEVAYELSSKAERVLLDTLLGVDKPPETEEEELSLRGVGKAQVKLATYYLAAGEQQRARTIYSDMENERPERLASIRRELVAVKQKDFWEITDRGDNLEYLEAERRDALARFFGWFPHLVDPSPPAGLK